MRVALIDDEVSVRETLKSIIQLHQPDLEIVGEAGDVQGGIEMLHRCRPDLLLLDIQLSQQTAFDLLETIKETPFKIIFITAYNNYAIKAFKFSAINYLLKPVDPDELDEALEKARELIDKEQMATKLDVFMQNLDALKSDKQKKITLHTSDSIHIVNTDAIVRCEAHDNYSRIYLEDGQELVVSHTLKYFDELLSEFGFIRPHKSHLVNMKMIRRLDKREGGALVMQDESLVPVSTRKKEKVLEMLKSF